MEIKSEKNLVEFFNLYSERLLPDDGKQFMKDLRKNMVRLPIPSGFNNVDPETSMEYAEWLIRKMEINYKRTKRDVIISCILASSIMAAVLLVLYGLGVFAINTATTVVVLTSMSLVSIGFIASRIPYLTKF